MSKLVEQWTHWRMCYTFWQKSSQVLAVDEVVILMKNDRCPKQVSASRQYTDCYVNNLNVNFCNGVCGANTESWEYWSEMTKRQRCSENTMIVCNRADELVEIFLCVRLYCLLINIDGKNNLDLVQDDILQTTLLPLLTFHQVCWYLNFAIDLPQT